VERFSSNFVKLIKEGKEAAMYILTAFFVVLLIVLAGAELFLAQFNTDELSSMGVEEP
jgi:hypothetical protein